jgi:hypothetical protein
VSLADTDEFRPSRKISYPVKYTSVVVYKGIKWRNEIVDKKGAPLFRYCSSIRK